MSDTQTGGVDFHSQFKVELKARFHFSPHEFTPSSRDDEKIIVKKIFIRLINSDFQLFPSTWFSIH